MTIRLVLALSALLAASASPRAQAPLVIGAGTAEWDDRAPAATDPATDAGSGANDLSTLWIESDADFLYLAAEVGAPVLLSDGNSLVLALDTDDDASTGFSTQGLGAELVWRFGSRSGTVYTASGSRSVEWSDIEFWTAPQITSSRFEMALPRDPASGVLPVVTGERVRVAVTTSQDAITAAADLSPQPRVRQPVDLTKQSPSHVRVLAYNVLRDQIFDSGSEAAYRRILQAIRPDVVVFSEIYNADASATVARLASLLDEPAGNWFGAKAGNDIIVVARTPVSRIAEVAGNGLFRVETPDGGDSDWIVAGMHPPCCQNDSGRQDEVDAMIGAIRDFRSSGTIPADAPLVIAGDMNFVGEARQLDTLFGGDIVNESSYGPDAPPDTDGSALTDAAPTATGIPAAYSWRSPSSDFPPGQLDYLAYSDAVLSAGRAFVLYTPGLTAGELTDTGLQSNDAAGRSGSGFASDHLPVVTDLFVTGSTSADPSPSSPEVEILGVAPNPMRNGATVRFTTSASGPVQATLHDALGRRVAQLSDGVWGAGAHMLPLDTRGLAPGVYVVRIETSWGQTSRRVAIIR